MTGFYTLLNTTQCSTLVDGAFQSGISGQATHTGILQFGQLFFHNAMFVPGLRETIISLGALDRQGRLTIVQHRSRMGL